MPHTCPRRQAISRDEDERKVAQFWRESHRTESTIYQYLLWVRRFGLYCQASGLSLSEQLTGEGVDRFARQYRGPRMSRPAPERVQGPAQEALLAWSYALRKLGGEIPQWNYAPTPQPVPPLIAEYVAYRQRYRGVAEGTLIRDIPTAREFLKVVRSRRRTLAQVRVSDIDLFIARLARRLSKRTIADTCSSLRAFLRFLHASGKLDHDLSEFVVAPRVRRVDRPPRALPWVDVCRILRAARGRGPAAYRDYAILLLMATYGLGAGEIVSIRIEEIDWSAALLRMRRPKTGVGVVLPLLPAVAKALAVYLQDQRPPHAETRAVFVSLHLPHHPMSTSAVRHLVRKHAHEAGVCAEILGGHTFRHSHATRQIDTGANLKIVGDILGHSRPESTSVYVRVALRRLRAVALPVPR